MPNSIEWGNYIPALPNNILIESSGGKKKATVKKMVVADPGLGMEVEFFNDPSEPAVSRITVDFKLFVGSEPPTSPVTSTATHSVRYGIEVNSNTLNLTDTYKFLVPFVDHLWLQENHEGENLYYCIIVKFNGTSIGNASAIIPASCIKPDQKFVYDLLLGGSNPYSHSASGVTYSDIYYHQLGVAWNEDYAQKSPTGTNLIKLPNGVTSFFVPFPSGGGYDRMEEVSVCFLAFPRHSGTAHPPEDYSLRTYYQGNNVDFNPGEGLNPATGALTLNLTAPPSTE